MELDPRNPYTLQQLAISYQFLRRYPEEAALLDRALTIVPNDVATKAFRALVDFNWKAETRPLHGQKALLLFTKQLNNDSVITKKYIWLLATAALLLAVVIIIVAAKYHLLQGPKPNTPTPTPTPSATPAQNQ